MGSIRRQVVIGGFASREEGIIQRSHGLSIIWLLPRSVLDVVVRAMVEGESCYKFLVVLWWSWRWRNAVVLESESWCLDQVCFRVNSILSDMINVFSIASPPARAVRKALVDDAAERSFFRL
ncbi:hypothetical protein RIF29_10803 [Crotalaria pallida]|uniref:Uncharacterized protein n=1 Tax=Crotalaria pallida TaxID=3830 RepID=A0AAN9G0B7_CROPI